MNTHIHRSLKALAVASITVLATASTHAATITWGAATNISGDTDVSTAGTLIAAYDVKADEGGNLTQNLLPPDPVVNGVAFSAFTVIPSTASTTVGSFTLSAATPTLSGLNFLGSGSTPFSTLSADYQTVLRSLAGNFAGSGAPVTLTLGGLTIGETYAFQWWVNASDLGYIDNMQATAGNSVTLDVNVGDVAGGTGQFAIGTFIADNASQDIVFQSTIGGNAFLNAFQLRQLTQVVPPLPPGTAIPEPGSALVGMLVLGLCSARLGRRRG